MSKPTYRVTRSTVDVRDAAVTLTGGPVVICVQTMHSYAAEVEAYLRRLASLLTADDERALMVQDSSALIDRMWEDAGHGTRREDIVKAFEAGVASHLTRQSRQP